MTLNSLPPGYRAVVIGATGGIGAAFTRALCADERCGAAYGGSRRALVDPPASLQEFRVDLEDEGSIASAAAFCTRAGPLHLVIVATGLLHAGALRPEKTYRSLAAESLQRAFQVNAIGPALIGKHFLGQLAQDRAVFAVLSARVGSIADNRLGGWHAYRASKAALNMLIRNFAVELASKNKAAYCVALHPGTVDTALSKPFQASVDPGRLFTADHSVECLLRVIDGLRPGQSGSLLAWDGATIPF